MGLDARVRYTKMVIQNSLIALLKRKPLNKVTVKELCELAQINRATFYKYYSDPFDLLDKIEQEMLSQIQERLNPLANSVHDVFVLIMENIQADSEKYRTLFSENGDTQFPGRIFALYYRHIADDISAQFQGLTPAQQEWLYYFLAQGCCGILTQWTRNGMKESVEEVSGFADRLIATVTKQGGGIV